MGELEAAIPKPSEVGEMLAATTRALLGQLPALGPIATETLNSVMNAREAERRFEFDAMVVAHLNQAQEHLASHDVILEYVASDEFAANVTRARRVAAETASRSKRERLAAAVASGGPWSRFSGSERAHFDRLIEDLDDLHVWLLHFFREPAAWLQAHDMEVRSYGGALIHTLEAALGHPTGDAWQEAVNQACADLEKEGLASIPLRTIMMGPAVDPRTSPRGMRFLEYIASAEPRAEDAEAPPEYRV